MGRKRYPLSVAPAPPLALPPHVAGLLGEEADALLEALRQPSPVSIRRNPAKPADTAGEPVPWCLHGRYLEQRPVFTLDPLLHAGAYYVQEAASMLLEQALTACGPLPPNAVALDLCAAPGGKATHLAGWLPPDALLIANEPVRQRQGALAENIWKWGRADVVLTGAEPQALAPLGAFCHLVVVDAPCSGEGMFRKDPHARSQWGPNLVATCAARQNTILEHAWEVLLPGGHLIYSTCTWETVENEDQVQRLVDRGAEYVPVPVDPAWGVVASGPGLRCYPHRMRGEGFFLAALRKPGDQGAEAAYVKGKRAGSELQPLAQGWLNEPSRWAGIQGQEVLHALDHRWLRLVETLAVHLPMLNPGLPVAMRKGGKWLPHPALALSTALRADAFTVLDLPLEEALRYLRGEALPASGAEGTALVRFKGLGLGWVNGAGNRWNNLWPAPWRIRMR